MRTETEAANVLCDLLDLERQELSSVKQLFDRGDASAALAAFRDRFVDLASTLDPGELPGFWLWTPTDANDLLRDGVISTAQYGEFDRTSSYILGPPGAAQWNNVPDDGYDVVLRDLSTMHWTNKLPEAYLKTANPEYLRAYLGYWDDYARNWLPAHRKILNGNVLIEWDIQPHVQRSIRWASESKLYFAWRLDNLFSWLPAAIKKDPAQAKRSLDPMQLATLIIHIVDFEIPGALNGLEAVGTPNQFVHCALGLLKASLLLQDLKSGPKWTKTAIEKMQWYAEGGGYLADGSDMEQSFNYNPGLIHSLDSVLHLARSNPPLAGQELSWTNRFEEMRDYRERFLDAVLMPDGRRPATGCDNTWRYSREEAVAEYRQKHADSDSSESQTLGEMIRDHLLGQGQTAKPDFTSIYFPYGGWLVMRDGWTPSSLYAFMKTSRPAPGHMREGGNGLAMSAYGRYFIVNSGADAYSDRGVFSRYVDSTVSQSSISVDGFSQVLNGSPKPQSYDKPIRARAYTSSSFDFGEGIYDSPYGGWNFRTGERVDAPIIDVTHVRQLVFLRKVGAWIVTDRLTSNSDHTYTTSWCLSPEFSEADVEVMPETASCRTHKQSGANMELRSFASSPIAISKHFGESDGTTALGWRALNWDEEKQRYTPAVDLLSELRGKGEIIIVTLIVPAPSDSSRVVECNDTNTGNAVGFGARLADGTELKYLASTGGTLSSNGVEVEGESLLIVTKPEERTQGLLLGEDGTTGSEFEIGPSGEMRQIANVGIPKGFIWRNTNESITPAYD